MGLPPKNLTARNFRGSEPIRENSKNYAPRKFGAIRYIGFQSFAKSSFGIRTSHE